MILTKYFLAKSFVFLQKYYTMLCEDKISVFCTESFVKSFVKEFHIIKKPQAFCQNRIETHWTWLRVDMGRFQKLC